jgi:alkyl hydroperoxide reductase subunit AhpC
LELNKELAMLTVGNKLPQFSVQACVGSTPDDLCEITDKTYAGKWLVLLFYPKDFTFICPTELVAFGQQLDEFTEREAVVLGGSTDNEYSHLAWRQSHPQLNELPYPLIAAQRLAADLGILDPSEHVCLRATLLVDPKGTIQWVSVNNLNTGRSVEEVLRVLQAVQSGELTACNWQPGQKYMEV